MALSESEELELLQLQKAKAMAMQGVSQQPQSFGDSVKATIQQAPQIASQAIQATSPAELTKKFFQTDPGTMQRVGGPALPLAGGAIGGPIGAAGGELLRQMTGTAFAPETVPKTPLGRFASVIGAGVAQEPKILEAIPGVPAVKGMISNLASNAGTGIAKGMQAFSGAKAGDLEEAARKGLSVYSAPSKAEAGAAMGKVIEKLPGENIAPTLKETVQSALTPEASSGNKYLLDLADKMDKGTLPDARQALKAKQSLDAVIDTVPIWQVKRRGTLFDLKNTFDDILSNQSGELKEASNAYRAASLKNNLTKPFPVNKHGEYSRLAGMLSTMGGSVGGAIGGQQGGAKGGIIGALAPLATAAVLSPASFGALAAGGGSAARGLQVLGQNPAIRQALMQTLAQIMRSKNSAENPTP